VDENELSKSTIARFVKEMIPTKRIPRPGDVDLVTGGPPCQGISGYNMCRNGDDPLADPKNRQMPLFFEVVSFLQPRYVLMENVADMFKFTTGIYGRFSVSGAFPSFCGPC
jgi:DNA (cytosine-5)-methyltransferase 1